MNKSAVALAADSAVTVSSSQDNSYKVRNSANKLFSLSKYAPVGLMIYGNANLLGIPWETIVKMYRSHLDKTEFATLTDYCKDFFSFLDKFDVTDDVQQRYLSFAACSCFQDIRKEFDHWVEEKLKAHTEVTSKQIASNLARCIRSRYDHLMSIIDRAAHSKAKLSNLRNTYRSIVKVIAQEIFEELPLSKMMHTKLLTIAINAASVGHDKGTGIVIAGFGINDLYPQCQEFGVSAVFAGKTIKSERRHRIISESTRSSIIPFAQSDDVRTFLEGIGPDIGRFLKESFFNIMADQLPNLLCDEAVTKLNLSEQQIKDLRKISTDMCSGACNIAFENLQEQQQLYYIKPVTTATSILNKSELAAMAETLVNLVSFRKQVTPEVETVGGPIDVAVITKGDGFIWVKRKHYFKPELNHQFFDNYYRKVNTDGK